ncbi:DUF5020 family protein [Kiritimatiellota bacterium B12222]|nr:DUF5020 family protein [Kiritimatiellota bacterium B12222]
MSKSIQAFLLLLCFTCGLQAQLDLQLLYNFDDDNEFLTSTVEYFGLDAYGRTYFFIDMNYNGDNVEGVSNAYGEFHRAFNISDDLPIGLHFEYDGGLGQYNTPEGDQAYTINSSYLTGLDFYWLSEDFSKALTLSTLYKYIQGKTDSSFQITLVWFANFFEGQLTVNGFADFWKEENTFNDVVEDYVFLSQPQFWYNVTENWAAGSEIQVGYNFGGEKGWDIWPTVAVKATF